MAKKNLAALMDGIIGGGENEPNVEETSSSLAPQPIKDETPIVETARRPGRPKKNSVKKEIRATFVMDPDLMKRLKYISLVDDILQKDILDEALNDYIRKWEAENGKIRLPKR